MRVSRISQPSGADCSVFRSTRQERRAGWTAGASFSAPSGFRRSTSSPALRSPSPRPAPKQAVIQIHPRSPHPPSTIHSLPLPSSLQLLFTALSLQPSLLVCTASHWSNCSPRCSRPLDPRITAFQARPRPLSPPKLSRNLCCKRISATGACFSDLSLASGPHCSLSNQIPCAS